MPDDLWIQGKVVDSQSQQGIDGYRVVAWGWVRPRGPKRRNVSKEIGQAITENGKFSIEVRASILTRLIGGMSRGKVHFRIFDSHGLLLTYPGDDLVWKPNNPEVVEIEIEQPSDNDNDYSRVKGRITRSNGDIFAGAKVRAYKRGQQTDLLLGEDTTESGGLYGIRYINTPHQQVDLYIKVFDRDGSYLTESEVIENAGSVETINLTVPDEGDETETWKIGGKIYTEYGLPAEGVELRIYRRDFGGSATKLGEATTLADGRYLFSINPGSKAASLEVRAVKEGREILLSNPVDDRGAETTKDLNLLAPADLQPLAAEYLRMKSDLEPHVGDMKNLADAREDSERHDLAVLNRATGWDARLIALAAKAERLSAHEQVDLASEGLYGLLRAGLPADKEALARISPDTVGKALGKMSDAGIVELSDQEITEFQEAFAGFTNRVRLATKVPGSQSTYADMLSTSGLDDEAQAKFSSLFFNHSGNAEKLWEMASEAGLDDGQIGQLKRQGKFAFLTGNSAAMTTRLSSKSIDDPVELVQQDFHQADLWVDEIYHEAQIPEERWNNLTDEDKKRLADIIPSAYTGSQITDRLNTYAGDMARKIRLSYPTQVVTRLVEKKAIKLPRDTSYTHHLLKSATQIGYRFSETPVESFLNEHPELREDVTSDEFNVAVENMKTLQRVYQITPGNDAMPVLMELEISSAYDVTAYPEEVFTQLYVRKYQELHGKRPPNNEARLIINKSRQISSVTNNLVTMTKKLDSDPRIARLSASENDSKAARENLIKRFPTMESLLGTMDFCECEHCRSVLSPAAYLVDLLQFIDPEEKDWNNFLTVWKTTHNDKEYPHKDDNGRAMTPYDVLIERRPDLPHTSLTCENTHTAMPYIDVVNEILEYYVAKGKLEEETALDTGDATTEELLAEPQNVIQEAYDKLNSARYPLDLPFDLWLETVREFCNYTNMPLDEVLDAFRETDLLFSPSQPYNRASLFIESLSISPEEVSLFTDTDPLSSGRWRDLYGVQSVQSELLASMDENGNPLLDDDGNLLLSVSNFFAATIQQGVSWTFYDVSENAQSDEYNTIEYVGEPDSGGSGQSVIRFTDSWTNPPVAGDLLTLPFESILQSAKYLSCRLGVTYKELTEIVQTGFVNPKLVELSLLYKLGVTIQDARFYREHIDLLGVEPDDLTPQERQQQQEVNAFFQRLQQFADTYTLSLEWLDAQVTAIPFDQVIVLADPDAGCNFDQTSLRYADGTAVHPIVFLKINLFVRLWRKLKWTIEDTDRSLQTFLPESAPFEPEHLDKKPLLTALIYLAHLKYLDDKLNINKQSRIKLLTLWSDIATTGKNPLYSHLFLTRSVLKSDPVFDHPLGQYLDPSWITTLAESRTFSAQIDNVPIDEMIDPDSFSGEDDLELFYDEVNKVQSLSYRGLLTDAKKDQLIAGSSSPAMPVLLDRVQAEANAFPLIRGHMLTLQGALGLTADEIRLILDDASQTDENIMSLEHAELSLANVSLLYRYALLSKALELSVKEMITLKQLSTLEPLKPLHPDPLSMIEEDYPFSKTIGFIEITDKVKKSGQSIEDLDYLLRHRYDETGKYRQDPQDLLAQLKSLAQGVRAIRSEHAIPEDPAELEEEALRQKLGLVLPQKVTETFIAMMNGTIEYTGTISGVAPDEQLNPKAFTDEPAIVEVRYNAVRQEQRLTIKGVLLDAAKADLEARLPRPVPPDQHEPSPLFSTLLDQIQQQARSFFDKHLQKQAPDALPTGGFLDYSTDFTLLFDQNPVLESGETEQDRIRTRRTKVVEAFLPYLQQRLINQFIVQTMTTQTGAEIELVESLLTDKRLLSRPQPLCDDLTKSADTGLTVSFFASSDCSGAPLTTITLADANTGLKDEDGTPLKPTDAQSARIEGYFEVPMPETYRFFVDLEKQGIEADLYLNHLMDPLFLSDTATTDSVELSKHIELKPGTLYGLKLELKDLIGGNARLLIQGESQPKDAFSQLTLYTEKGITGAERASILLDKVLQITQSLGLNEKEIRYLTTHASAFDNLNLGNIPTTKSDNSHAPELFKQFIRLAGYAFLKRDLVDGADDLITLFEANSLTSNDKLVNEVYPRVARLTRRDESIVKACAEALFKTPDINSEKPLQRLWQALQITQRFGSLVASLLEWLRIVSPGLTATQRYEIARDMKEVTKSRFEPQVWQSVAQPIFNRLRQRQRDALSAYVMHQNDFERMEQLYEYFLIDPGMEPLVQTSRIRLAIASVQLFIQRCLLNLELKVEPSTIVSKQWEWMKRYRVWEANRKIFLFPENWLEPEFRDDKTYLFTELEGALLQGDVSKDLVEDAFLNYLKKLDELARLDIVAMHIEEVPNDTEHTLHVIGRTFSKPHKYFYRRHAHRMWTPWEPVSAEIQGDHLAPVIWRDRLYLFWVTFMDKPNTESSVDSTTGSKNTGDLTLSELVTGMKTMVATKQIDVELHWSELIQGEWSTRQSGGLISRIVPTDFRSGNAFIHVSKEYDPDDGRDLGVYIHLGGEISQSFYMAGRNSDPEPSNYMDRPANPFSSAVFETANRYVGSGALKVSYQERYSSEFGVTPPKANPSVFYKSLLPDGRYTILPCNNNMLSARGFKQRLLYPDKIINDFGLKDNQGTDRWSGWRLGTSGIQSIVFPRMVADMTGNGRADIIGFGIYGTWVAYNNGDGTFQKLCKVSDDFGADYGYTVNRHLRVLTDLTNNGCADIIGFHNYGVFASRNNGDCTFQDSILIIEEFGAAQGWDVVDNPRFVVDLTGDGFADIVGIKHDGIYVSYNNNNFTFQDARLILADFGINAGWRSDNPRFITDLTGDGCADIIGFKDDGVYVALNDGSGNFNDSERVLEAFGVNTGDWNIQKHKRLLTDLTGDGRPDIIGFGNDGVYVALNNGDGGFFEPRRVLNYFGYNAGEWEVDKHPRLLADLTGDGSTDIIGFGDTFVYISINNGNGTFQNPRRIMNNLGRIAKNYYCYDSGWRTDMHPRYLADLTGDGRADIIGFDDYGTWATFINYGDFQSSKSEIDTLEKPIFYQDNQHTFFIESNLEEETIHKLEGWVVLQSTQSEMGILDELTSWDEYTIETVLPLAWASSGFADISSPDIDSSSLIALKSHQDWIVNSETTIEFDGVDIGAIGVNDDRSATPAGHRQRQPL